MNTDLLYQIALSLLPRIGHVHAKILVERLGGAEQVFREKRSALEKIEGIGSFRAASIKGFRDFSRAEEEMAFVEKYQIQPLFLTDKKYPRRLLHCYDAPVLLYYKGDADLNRSRMLAVVGTRSNSEYGRLMVETLVQDLADTDILIVSGLAFGIDAHSHRAAIKYGLPTVGVLAHGLDKMYPREHGALAREMLINGGLLTEFCSRTKPDKHQFPIRNRIVAGMCDAVVVIETGCRGGSMITAELANGYNRDVFAFPGRTTDAKSAGCLELIRLNKAILLTQARQLKDLLGWAERMVDHSQIKKQRELFLSLSELERKILDLLRTGSYLHIDEINHHSQASASAVAAAMLNLELEGLIRSLPGKMHTLTEAILGRS